MGDGELRWHPRPLNLRERIVASLFLALLILDLSSGFAGWRVFAGYEKQVGAALVLLGLVLMRFFPTVRRS
jgi:hypothetical protein